MSATLTPSTATPPTAAPSTAAPSTRWAWTRAPASKLTLLSALLLALIVPNEMVSSVIDERASRQAGVEGQIAQSWGAPQTLFGPILVVPWREERPGVPLPNMPPPPPVVSRGSYQILPQRLSVQAHLAPEQRRRGVFGTVVYRADIAIEGSLVMPDVADPGHPGAKAQWQDAYVMVGAADLRGASADTALAWDGVRREGTQDLPIGETCGRWSVMGWPLHLTDAPAPHRSIPFATQFALRGTRAFSVAPFAHDVRLRVDAPWATPSFEGASLPAERTVSDQGFQAEWSGGVGLRQTAWPMNEGECGAGLLEQASQSSGVELLEAVPTYRMVSRASKYALLFMTLSFLTYFLFEMLARVRIHLMQYGLLGLSLSLFSLLLLAAAEPLGFIAAYGLATAAVLAQATLFTLAVTRRSRLAALFGAVLAGLFGFLFVVLQQESFSLLSGAVALFAILSVVMAATRRVDWSAR